MDKKQVAAVLEEIGTLLELKGENPFKSRAYVNAARIIEGLGADLNGLVSTGEISKVKGIGDALSKKIRELVTTDHLKYYEDLRGSFPEGILQMLSIPGLGPKKVKTLYEKLGISSIAELRQACETDQLLTLDGFGHKSQEKILQGIQYLEKHQDHHLINFALEQGQQLLEALEKHPGIIRISLAGSLRRQKETVKDIDLVGSTRNEALVMDYFTRLPAVERLIASGETKSSVLLKSGINADLRLVSDTQFPFALHHFTGSREHNTAMRARSKARGMKMNEYGLFRGEVLLPCRDETQVFGQLDLAYIPPELREDMGEIEAAEAGQLPKLVELRDLKGILHVHTTYSDGVATLEEMARAARSRGYEYLGVSDHSQSAFYARGLKIEDVIRQHEEIDRLNLKLKPFRILKGIESDILADGALDYPDDVLVRFDFVIAAVHSRFNLSESQMTSRICRALENKHVTMLAHPSGRLLLSREPYALDFTKVIETAAANNVIVEINAHPMRLDLDWRMLKYAKELGLMISINPDAHNIEGYDDMRYGVGIARKGWLEASNVLNAQPLSWLLNFLKRRRTS
jgi:DNA polymerase (family 10)